MRVRICASVGAAAVVLATVMVAPSAGAATTAAAPARPSTGRFHPLSDPVRLIGTTTTSVTLSAAGRLTVHAAGTGGLPASGIAALAVTITTEMTSGTTQVWAGPGPVRPTIAAVVAPTGSTSGFTVVPLSSTGVFTLWNGPKATKVTIDAVGYFSSSAQSDAQGLFTRLPGATTATLPLPAGSSTSVRMLGVAGVPTAGVSAVLARVTTTAAGAGLLGAGSTLRGAAGSTAVAYRPGTGSDLVVFTPATDGTAQLRNGGTGPVKVRLDAVGWFTDGSDRAATGDALTLVAPASVLNNATITTTGSSLVTAGAQGIPAGTASRPPSLVLLRSTARSTAATSLTVDAAGATPTGASALTVAPGSTRAGLVLAPPASSNATRLATSTGQATVSAESYGYFSGGLILATGLRVLTASSTGALTSVTASSLTFRGTPTQLSVLHVGDVLAAGSTAMTPDGLLRTVVSVSSSGGNLVLATRQARLTDAIVQGTVAAGTSAAGVTTAAVTFPLGAGSGSCAVSGALFRGGTTLSCSDSISGTAGGGGVAWSADISASASFAVNLSANVQFGLPPTVSLTTGVTAGAVTTGSVRASASADLDESFPMGERRFAPITLEVGIPIVIVPIFTAQLHITGHVDATFQATGEVHASFGTSYTTGQGFTTSHNTGGSGSGGFSSAQQPKVTAAFEPTIEASLYGVAGTGVTATVRPYVELAADSCDITGKAGVDLVLGLTFSLWGQDLVDQSVSIPLVATNLFTTHWRNCAVWSGTISYRALDHVGASPAYTLDLQGSSSMSISPVTSPPEFGVYPATASGSGASKEQWPDYCYDNAGVKHDVQQHQDVTWSGPLTMSGSAAAPTVTITPAGDVATGWLLGVSLGYTIPGTVHRYGIASNCTAYDDTTDTATGYGVFGLIDKRFAARWSDGARFDLPAGARTATGTRTLPQDGTDVGGSITYSLTKTCTRGGTTC